MGKCAESVQRIIVQTTMAKGNKYILSWFKKKKTHIDYNTVIAKTKSLTYTLE